MRLVNFFLIPTIFAFLCSTFSHEIQAQSNQNLSERDASSRQTLATHIAAPSGLKPLGRLAANQPLELKLTLKLRNPEQMQSLLQDLYNPASPEYRHFLSVAEFTEQFAPSENDLAEVQAYAKAHGLTVTDTSSNRLVVAMSGPVAAVERAFGVKMQIYPHPTEARAFYAPDVEPSLDTALPVQGITGLSTLYVPHPASKYRPAAAGFSAQIVGGSASNGSFLGSDLRNAYAPGVTLDGTGQSIGIFSMESYNLSDIQGYFTSQGQSLTVPIVNVLLDGMNGSCGTSCDDSEAALDIEMALSLAPNLSAVVFYEGSTPLDILNRMATDNISRQLSCSYVFTPDPASYEPIFQEFALQGQSFFASSGDGGAFSLPDCSGSCWNSLFPADDPYVTAVGGTVLTTASAGGAYASEAAWPDSGGGINDFGYPIASYQAPLINATNQGSPTLRNIPDVAAVATNVYAEFDGDQGSAGGTSAATPIWASFMALVNQQANGMPIGFLNPPIYALAQTAGYSTAFHDVASGNNFNSYSPNLYAAVAGYDLATGLGSPNGQSLINALSPVTSSANFSLQASSSTVTLLQGAQGSVQIFLLPSNGFTGTVTLRAAVLGAVPGVSVSLNQPSISGANTSNLTITTTGAIASPFLMVGITGTSGNLLQSLYLPVTVQLPNLAATAVSAPPATITPGATFSVTDTTANQGQAPAGASVTQFYLSDSTSQNGFLFPVGSRAVGALAAQAASSGSVTATVPSSIWPNTPYYLLACANSTNSVIQAASGSCIASATTAIYSVAAVPTTTTLTVTSSGSPVTQVAAGAKVSLTATVTSGSTAIHPGLVKFCDATASYCTDSHLFGTAQLKQDGTATLHFLPAIGSYSYKAVFAGTGVYASSASSSASLAVNGTRATTNAVAVSGSEGNYSLFATVTGMGGNSAPTGSVSFLDTSVSDANLGSASLVAGTPSLNWLNAQNPTAGADPQGVAAGDFNGDGIPDLAVANRNDGTVTILLGKGDGTFTAGTTVQNVISAQAIAVGDFNSDGKLDLAVTNSEANTVTILLGNGDGTFTAAASTLTTGVLPAGLAVGDLNGDGFPDLVVANYANNVISVFLSNGDGTFTAAPSIAMQGAPQSIAIADFNGDGKADLAVANARPNNESVVILLGNGDGTFMATNPTLLVGEYPSAIVAADFNGDGKMDLAVTIAFGNSVVVFTGNGDGTFHAVSASPATGSYPLTMVTADFNGDGLPDLAVANSGDSTITILLGQGDGNFTASSIGLASGVSPVSIAAADFNGDGYADLGTANELGNTASVFVDQWQQIATATLNNVDPVGAGTHLVEASYAGNATFSGSTSAAASLAGVTTPMVTVTPVSSSITTLQSLQVTIAVSGSPTPTGAVVLTGGGYTSTSTALANGSATILIPAGELTLGSDTLTTSYTPDSASASAYSTATGTSSPVSVSKTTPTITWVTPAAINYGTALSATQLNANSGGIAGNLVYTPALGVVLAAGQQTLSVTFTPTDTSDYNPATTTVILTVNQATPTITWPTASAITYGQTLASSTLTGGASTPTGSFAFTTPTTAPGAGTASQSVTFTPSDATDYSTLASTVSVTVNKATPTITWATPAAITYGTALSATQLNANSTVAGTFAYTPAAGTTPAVGSDTLSATFTPTDATDYKTAMASVTLVVNSPPNPVPVLSSISPAYTAAGGSAFTLTLTGTGFASASTVYWGTTTLATQVTSATQLTATVTAVEIASAGITGVSVQSPTPGGGVSNALQFEVDSAGSGSGAAPTFTTLTAAVAAGTTASYAVTLSSSATNVSVNCLNLPTGATCSYSSTTGAVTIATLSSTPKGTYPITVIFTETLPGAASGFVLLPVLLLPLLALRKRLIAHNHWFTASLSLVLLAGVITAVGCGGGSGSVTQTNPMHQVTSSGGVTLTIQ